MPNGMRDVAIIRILLKLIIWRQRFAIDDNLLFIKTLFACNEYFSGLFSFGLETKLIINLILCGILY